jgi:hypothetical protein
LIPEFYIPEGVPPPEVPINPYNDDFACRAFLRNKLVRSADCYRFAAPIGKSRSGLSRLIEIETEFHPDMQNIHKRYVIEEIANLSFTANMAYENAQHIQSIELDLDSKVKELQLSNEVLSDVLKRQTELATLVNWIQRNAPLQKKLYFVLTGLTIKHSLEFNRAMLFLINEETQTLSGEMAIGPHSFSEYCRVNEDSFFTDTQAAIRFLWTDFDVSPSLYLDTPINTFIRRLHFNIDSGGSNVLIESLTMKEPHIFRISEFADIMKDSFLKELKDANELPREIAVLPLCVENAPIGVICVDNRWDSKNLTKDFIDIATLFAAQAATLIQQAKLAQRNQEMEERRNDFLNMASHELKTPVQILTFLAEQMRKRGCSSHDLAGC